MRVDQPLYLLQSMPPKNLLERVQRRNGKGRGGGGAQGAFVLAIPLATATDHWPRVPTRLAKGAT